MTLQDTQTRGHSYGESGDFSYAPANGGSGRSLAVSIYTDQADVRQQWREDAENAGLSIRRNGSVADLLSGDVGLQSSDLVLLDCCSTSAELAAQYSWLDMRIAKAGAQALVTTSFDALDQVFGCFDQSAPEILVNPTRPERVIALGRVMAKMSAMSLREMSQDDRLMLLRLTEQVEHLAERLDSMSGGASPQSGGGVEGTTETGKLRSPALAFAAQDSGSRDVIQLSKPALPDPRLVRRIIRQRQLRARFFDAETFADPAWDMLLDLTAARAEHTRVCVTSLCIASGVPPTTALRWITQMTQTGLFERVEDESDKRRAFVQLSDKAADAMARYFAELGKEILPV